MRNRLTKLSATLLMATMLLTSCQEDKTIYSQASGTYELVSVILSDQEDISNEYTMYRLTLRENQTMEVFISKKSGQIIRRNSTYSIKNDVLKEVYQKTTYDYQIDIDLETITYLDNIYNQDALFTFIKMADEAGIVAVDFEDVLFGGSIDDKKIYNYAPTALREIEDGKEVIHIWYCTNELNGIIVDYIGYRKGIKNDEGKWEFSEQQIVLRPTEDTWDFRHTCDPSVIKGEFHWNNETYTYMMAYLGCQTSDYSNNETGLAVAKKPEGPWIKLNHINPIVPWERDHKSGTWGTGMPSLISADKKGMVYLAYINAGHYAGIEKWDFSNLDNPNQIFISSLNPSGLQSYSGTQSYVSYVELAYDQNKGRLYLLSGTPPKNPDDGTRTLVFSHAMIAYIDGVDTIEKLDAKLISSSYQWNTIGYVGPDDTGWSRNHNSALLTDPYGHVFSSRELYVIVSTGRIDYPTDNIFTYRLRGYIFDL